MNTRAETIDATAQAMDLSLVLSHIAEYAHLYLWTPDAEHQKLPAAAPIAPREVKRARGNTAKTGGTSSRGFKSKPTRYRSKTIAP